MLQEYKTQVMTGVWSGIFFFAIGWIIFQMPDTAYRYFGKVTMAGGYLLFLAGCVFYAKGKGQNAWWGMLGALGPVGLLFLYALRDKSKMVLKKRKRPV